MFLSILRVSTKQDTFFGHFVYKLENEEIYTEKISLLPFAGSETC